MSFAVDEIVLRMIRIPLKTPFVASFGTIDVREVPVVEIRGRGVEGWGESPVMPWPLFNHETPDSAYSILKKTLIPTFVKMRPEAPYEISTLMSKIVGNKIALSGLETAYWDWYSRVEEQPLYRAVGGVKSKVSSGVSLGVEEDLNVLLEKISLYRSRNYHRIKIKIMPGSDLEVLGKIRNEFPDLVLTVDANGGYTIDDIGLFKEMDGLGLTMIEQPFGHNSFIEHARLQREIDTPVCLDESVEDISDLKMAKELGSCRIVNLKVSRVGGLSNAGRLVDFAASSGVDIWCGAMLETVIGRAVNRAAASLAGVNFPGDIYEGGRHYDHDLGDDNISWDSEGYISLPDVPGSGIEIDKEAIRRLTVSKESFRV